ncbi:aspartate kinase [Ligilactobacillus sp. WC1T17]|uniref:Aspartokinase n=1 Tax=Ligilactobacillus ruminis TaxID=1623 RepID=A0ABY1ACK4_9LACO|nr:aspartate kinase [Ligilactobacillus ruminis]
MKKVVKFGGSSLADAKQVAKACQLIKADKTRQYVIPSAPGKRFEQDQKVTDMLINCYQLASSKQDFLGQLAQVKGRFQAIIKGLKLDLSLEEDFSQIKQHLNQKPQFDYVASRGEYLNGKILAAYLKFDFIDPYEYIFFNEDGYLNSYKTQKNMARRLSQSQFAVIPGFYGQAKDGQVKTFSRGGSDITGSIVAAACEADIYENWTDVSGFLVADPKIVAHPVPIKTITYRELRELSYMGASVLHEAAIFPVRSKGIPINIKNTNKPDDDGTWIVESTARKTDYIITGIAGKKGFCSLTVTKDLMNSEIGFCRRALQAFEDCNLSIEHMPSGIDTMTVVVHEDEFLDKEQAVVTRLHRLTNPDSIEIEADLALIAVVGRGMKDQLGTAARLFSALAKEHINIKMIDQGSSELNIIIAVAERDFENAIRAIYQTFVK